MHSKLSDNNIFEYAKILHVTVYVAVPDCLFLLEISLTELLLSNKRVRERGKLFSIWPWWGAAGYVVVCGGTLLNGALRYMR